MELVQNYAKRLKDKNIVNINVRDRVMTGGENGRVN
jgi:hypothetical protein